jgi:uncharacterized protein (DUF433 family)
MSTVAYPHIVRDSEGRLRIEGAWYKVILLLEEHVYRGWDADELVEQHPQLTLAQAHAVLGYYYDNKEDIDAEIRRREEEAKALLSEIPEPPTLERLRKLKKDRAASRGH